MLKKSAHAQRSSKNTTLLKVAKLEIGLDYFNFKPSK